MNDVIRAILERRSVRKFKPDPIADADRDLIVKAGLHAPSAKNMQGWHVTVVQNREVIDRITEETKAALIRAKVEKYLAMANSPNYSVNFKTGPVFMIVSADPGVATCPAEDCSLVLGNMFLAAHSLGIGSCWINQLCPVTDEPAFRAFITTLGVPENCKIHGCAVFGYNAGEHPKAPPRKEGTVNIIE